MDVETPTCEEEQIVFLESNVSRARGRRISPLLFAGVLLTAGIGGRFAWSLRERRMEPNEVTGLDGSDLCMDQRTISMNIGMTGISSTELNKQSSKTVKEACEKEVKEAIAKKAGVLEDNVDVGAFSGSDLSKAKITISVPAGITADSVMTNLQDGVDAAASMEKKLQAVQNVDQVTAADKTKDDIRVYTSALSEDPLVPAEGFEAEVSVDLVIVGDGINFDDDKKKETAYAAVRKAVASKAKVDEQQIVVLPTESVTAQGKVEQENKQPKATISVVEGTSAKTIVSNLREGADVALSVEAELKAITGVHPDSVSVFSSQIRQPAVRKNAHHKVLLKMQIHQFPDLDADQDNLDKAQNTVKDTILSKLQLRESDVSMEYGVTKPATDPWQVKAFIAVPGVKAENQLSSLQSTLQSGVDLSASVEEKLEALSFVVDDIEVYRANLKVEEDTDNTEFVLDLLVEGIDFGKLDALPALQHNIRKELQNAVAKKAQDTPTPDFIDSVKLIRPCQMSSAPVLFRAKIPVEKGADDDATKKNVKDMETKLTSGVDDFSIACAVQTALITKVEDALSTKDIHVHTAAELPEKKHECA